MSKRPVAHWVAVMAPAALIGTATAQTADQDKPKNSAAQEIETVEVVGTRASLKSAIERKRSADTVSDSIVAEDIAQFPDKNVGEALSRVTGVQLSRDFGEGTQVSIRGVEPALNRVEINGMSVLSASGGSARSNDFREFASELIKTVDVIKGSTADITEGGIGGTVKIELRKPLELAGPLLSATASAEQMSLGGGWEPRGNVTAATQLFDDHVGIMANVTYDHVLTRQDYLRNTEWVRLGDWDDSPEKTIDSLNPTYDAVATESACDALPAADRGPCRQQWWDYSPRIPRYGIWLRDDKRTSAQLTLQFKINEQNNLWVEGTRAEREQFLNDHNFGTDFTDVRRVALSSANLNDGLATGANVQVDDHHVVGYTTSPVNSTNAAIGTQAAFGTSARGFDLKNTTDYLSAGYEFRSEHLDAKVQASEVSSFRDDDTNAANFTARITGLRVDLDDQGVPRFTFPAGASMDDDAIYYTAQLQYRPSENKLVERNTQADFDFKPEWKVISGFEAGIQKRTTTSKLWNGGGYVNLDAGPATGAGAVIIPSLNINLTANRAPGAGTNTTVAGTGIDPYNLTYTWNDATFNNMLGFSSRSPGTFYDGYSVAGGNIPTDWRIPVFADLTSVFDTTHFTHDELRHVTVNGVEYDRLPAHDLEEAVLAEYFKINIDTELFGMSLRGNVGVREVKTDTTGDGALTQQELRTVGSTTATTVGVVRTHYDRSYSDTLPSANLQLGIKENFSVRLGYAEVMSRPPITELAPTGTCVVDVRPGASTDNILDTCNVGNPSLKPYRAKSYDLEFAWYPTDEVETRIGGFYKDITSYILQRTTFRNVPLFGDGSLYDLTMPINGKGAKTQGVEASIQAPFSFLPGWASGFGGIANYTYSEAKDVNLFSQLDGSPLPFPGLSKNSYNLVLYYDKGPINARVAWNSRTDWLVSAADRSGNPVFRAGEDYLDARVQWRIKGDTLSVFVEGKNLTDQASLSYAGEKFRLSELGWPGRRYFVGVSWKPIS
ncbi:MAG TPA: TonB-dependent receptor [Steroidobacteraceae bacterium]|nr:TonB-dependent receptor [Steroidobacteraceae bacterium]